MSRAAVALLFLFPAALAWSGEQKHRMKSYDELTQALRGFQVARILLTAVELDVFAAVGDGATAAGIAAHIQADPRATEMLLNALVAVQALDKRDARFLNTPASRRLAGARDGLMHTVNLWNSWSGLTGAVRAGTAVRQPGVETQEAAWTKAFIAAMHSGAVAQAGEVASIVGASGVGRLLDVGGGSGAYAIAFAQANPELKAEVLDLAQVTPIAAGHIREAGLEARVTTRVGDLTRDDFGKGYDLVLLSAICHMLGEQENLDLFRRCARALQPGGRLVIRDFILEPDRTAPPSAAMFALNMLVNTRRGNTYTELEYRSWLESAGFAGISRPVPGGDLLIGTLELR